MHQEADITVILSSTFNVMTLTGHSLRVTGAQFLASLGLEVALIQILGRWDSSMVLRYVADAPANAITTHLKKQLSTASLEHLWLRAHGQMQLPSTVVGEAIVKYTAEEDCNNDVMESMRDDIREFTWRFHC